VAEGYGGEKRKREGRRGRMEGGERVGKKEWGIDRGK